MQERSLAALVASSPEAVDAFIGFGRVEAATLLRSQEHVVRALTAELLVRRTMTGDAVDAVIVKAVAAKALADEQARRAGWKRVEESAHAFLAEVRPWRGRVVRANPTAARGLGRPSQIRLSDVDAGQNPESFESFCELRCTA